jgi:predicted molibdopterin-dependent oxidoreductase YjgC
MERIVQHPILDFPQRRKLNFTYDGEPMQGLEGDTVQSALHANGVVTLAYSHELHRPRGFYCAIGNCSSCMMTVDGVPNVKTCAIPLREGMDVRTQRGKGVLG